MGIFPSRRWEYRSLPQYCHLWKLNYMSRGSLSLSLRSFADTMQGRQERELAMSLFCTVCAGSRGERTSARTITISWLRGRNRVVMLRTAQGCVRGGAVHQAEGDSSSTERSVGEGGWSCLACLWWLGSQTALSQGQPGTGEGNEREMGTELCQQNNVREGSAFRLLPSPSAQSCQARVLWGQLDCGKLLMI